MKIITEEEAMEYESMRIGFVISFIYVWFPKLFVWKYNRNYKRYLASMCYKLLAKEKDKELREQIKKSFFTVSKN